MKNTGTKIVMMATGAALLVACAPSVSRPPIIPSLEYSKRMRGMQSQVSGPISSPVQIAAESPLVAGAAAASAAMASNAAADERRAKLRLAADQGAPQPEFGTNLSAAPDIVTNMPSGEPGYTVQDNRRTALQREYVGPLTLGDPGVTASLWHESRGNNDFFRDNRAFQPMDLITIVITEKAKGEKKADTEVKSKSDVSASISKFFGFENKVAKANDGDGLDPSALVEAATKNDFKGEGDTNREGSLIAKISAMVVEVLPSNILRVEGEKIISVNSEEEVMVISGLVRPEDVSSTNEIDSSKIANMRIDYYGTGTVGDAQHGGWMGRLMKRFWPF